jgi:DNA invertase Pin-like site-specific DNA recombinase
MASTSTSEPRSGGIYCRLSVDRNKDKQGEGLAVDKQEADGRDLVPRLHPPVVIKGIPGRPRGLGGDGVYSDNDISAYKGRGKRAKRRPGYEQMLADIEAGLIDAVIAWHTDRLHRNTAELERYITVCGEGRGGVPTYTVRGGDLDLSTSSGRMVARILGAIAQGEVEHMIERQMTAKERIRAAGGWQGGPRPFGFTPDGPSINNGGTGRLAQVPDEAKAISDGIDYVLANAALMTGSAADRSKAGLSSIARDWTRRGLSTPREASRGGQHPWRHSNVRRVLMRAMNAGLVEYEGTLTTGNWDPIVSEDKWRAVCAVLNHAGRKSTPGPQPRHLLTGVLVCGVCGGDQFRVIRAGDHKRAAYNCASYSARSEKQEDGTTLDMSRINGCVSRDAERLDLYVESIILARFEDPRMQKVLSGPGVDVAALEAGRAAIDAELDEWAGTPGMTPARYKMVAAQLVAEREQIAAKIEGAWLGTGLEAFAAAAGDPQLIADIWDGMELMQQRAIAAKMLRVVLHPSRGQSKPPGWRVGQPHPFDDRTVSITSPAGLPWGDPGD